MGHSQSLDHIFVPSKLSKTPEILAIEKEEEMLYGNDIYPDLEVFSIIAQEPDNSIELERCSNPGFE